ncbi:PI-PLC X domain-containing protein 2-like [Tachypleus tridentatus]|uniref:PI-PLC X domain-containing protein 2-like n=1 Tax=Tachypleus tridentatus TaxID=6853 RepID=UPI003FD6169F
MASHENFEGVFLHSDVEIEHINYKNENHALILKQWMQDLPEKIHNLPLNCIAIPGSHESGTYSVSAMDDYAPDGLFLSKSRAVQLLGSTAKKVICGWMKTQDLTCKEQLEIGIRYFDFKVATKPGSSDLYIVHGLYGDSMTSVLDSIKEFLDLHPKEVVLLHFQQLFAMTNDDHHRLL